MFGKKEEVVYFNGPLYKKVIQIRYEDRMRADTFEINSYHIDDVFLKIILPTGDVRYIKISAIRSFDIIHHEIEEED